MERDCSREKQPIALVCALIATALFRSTQLPEKHDSLGPLTSESQMAVAEPAEVWLILGWQEGRCLCAEKFCHKNILWIQRKVRVKSGSVLTDNRLKTKDSRASFFKNLALIKKDKQKLTQYKPYTDHWTNLRRRAETKRKKVFNLEAWEKEISNTIS